MTKVDKNIKSNESDIEKLETLNVGIVGHIDHGKTTLLHKLSGKWTDTHSEELKRGITIKLGYADIILYEKDGEYNMKEGKAFRHVSFVDAPGHEMLMATMLSGAAIIDAAILVVAANEGIKPQTREHIMALSAKRIKHLIVVQNKIDLVNIERARENYKEIQNLLKGKFDSYNVIPVSAQQEVNINEIYRSIAEVPLPKRDLSGKPVFIVARSFDVNKPGASPANLKGAVLGGTLKSGKLKVGDQIEIKPGMVVKEANQYHYRVLKTKIVRLFKGSKSVQELTPGGSMSLESELDMVLGKNDALAGCVVSKVGELPEAVTALRVKSVLFPEVAGTNEKVSASPIKVSEMLLLSINTSMTVGLVKRMNKDELELSLKVPIVPFKGDNAGISRNINNHWRLIGYGEII